ncbi:hypothetical protein B0H19DRAFT_1159975 [Mycena capillaripes]|nr:hypothetical protein B0H19DRAFT_1159975 [Mycena capillaripes]
MTSGSFNTDQPSPMSNDSLPTGCSASDFNGATAHTPINATSSFVGCWVGVPSVLQTCCSQSGSTAAFVNGTCGCPFPSVQAAATALDTFGKCASDKNVTAECGQGTKNAARGDHGARFMRGNLAAVVLCVSLLLGAVGV